MIAIGRFISRILDALKPLDIKKEERSIQHPSFYNREILLNRGRKLTTCLEDNSLLLLDLDRATSPRVPRSPSDTNVPNPVRITLSSPFSDFATTETIQSKAFLESAFDNPDPAAIASINSVLFMMNMVLS